MAAGSFQVPDVLVLGGGGILGEAWMRAVLAGLEESTGFSARSCSTYIGTSAGSIVAAQLAARGTTSTSSSSERARAPGDGNALQALRATAGGAAAIGLRWTAGAGALARRTALARAPRGSRSLAHVGARIDELAVRFDGRLLIVAVELESGRRVVFGSRAAPRASVAQAVEASCAIPGVFRPITVEGRTYVDGGAWSPTNMDVAAVTRDTTVLCLNPTGSLMPQRSWPLGALGPVSRTVAAVEALALERRGAHVQTISPDAASVRAMGPDLMDPAPRSLVTEAGRSQGLALGGGTTHVPREG